MLVLVTGAAGFIGSHTLVSLLEAGHDVIAIDNLSNSNIDTISKVEEITNCTIPFYEIDICDEAALNKVLSEHQIEACIHCAGYKSISDSIKDPYKYYKNNVGGTLSLIRAISRHNCKNFIFSSSASVYGIHDIIELNEETPKCECTNPYSRTKSIVEDFLIDLHRSDNEWNIVILRYFNPIGAHPSGKIGESPKGVPNNLMPYITQVAIGAYPQLNIFGNDFETHDGTGVRDYIHVMDIAEGHLSSLNYLKKGKGIDIFNLGTGKGYSVLDIVNTFMRVNGVDIPYEFKARRDGDVAAYYSVSTKANEVMGWKSKYSLEDMCRDSWNWQKNNSEK